MNDKTNLKKLLIFAIITSFFCVAFTPSMNAEINKVKKLTGTTIWIGVEYNFYYTFEDPDEDKWFIMIDWGDGTKSDWFGPYKSGETVSFTHYWKKTGNYAIKLRIKDEYGYISEWSNPFPISVIHPNRFFKNIEITGTLKTIPLKGIIFGVLSFEKAEITKAISKKVQLDPFICHNYRFFTLFLNVRSYNKETMFINASTPFAILIGY